MIHLSSIQLMGGGFRANVHSTLSNTFQLSAKEWKIISVAFLIFVVLGGLVYRAIRRCWSDKINQRNNIHSLPAQIQPLAAPPLPKVDYNRIFEMLAEQTPVIPSLPITKFNCQFGNIGCPRDTRVDLPGTSEKFYLHANHVTLENCHFILTQYPLISHFSLYAKACQMASLVVDLTNDNDMTTLHAFYPEPGQTHYHGLCHFTCTHEQLIEGIKAHLYTYHIEDKEDSSIFDFLRLNFEGWDDHHGISEDDLDQLIAIIESYQKKYHMKPVMLHCRAGVGRSGTVAVAYALKHLMEQGKVNPSNLLDHLQRLILTGRVQRGACFVQTVAQFIALWKWSWRALHRMQIPIDSMK